MKKLKTAKDKLIINGCCIYKYTQQIGHMESSNSKLSLKLKFLMNKFGNFTNTDPVYVKPNQVKALLSMLSRPRALLSGTSLLDVRTPTY